MPTSAAANPDAPRSYDRGYLAHVASRRQTGGSAARSPLPDLTIEATHKKAGKRVATFPRW